MKYDAVIISEDRYLVEAIKQEIELIGDRCGSSMDEISDGCIVIYDASSEKVFPKTDNDVIYIFPHDTPRDQLSGSTVFVRPFLMEELLSSYISLKNMARAKVHTEPSFTLSVSDTFLIVCGKRVDLTKNEMLIFSALWENKGNAVGRDILDRITRANSNGNMVTVYINRLREKLSSATDKRMIVTVRDKGYMIPEM